MINSKKRIIVMLSFLALLFIFIIGISYAYYATDVKGNLSDNPSLKLTSGYLSMVYEGGDTSITGGSTENDITYTKNFTIKNDGVANSNFGIWIKNYKVKDVNGAETSLSYPNDWTYTLSSGDTIIKSGTFPEGDEAIISVYPLSVEETIPLTFTLKYNYIDSKEAEDLGMTQEEAAYQTADMGKVLSFDIVVTQAIDKLNNTSEGTLLYAINEQYQASIIRNESDLITIPGQEISDADEAILATTLDNYGTSYYFRGNVENNYVTFAGMCWRIVRIDGNGNTKLILEDQDEVCSTTMNGNWDIEASDGTSITKNASITYRTGNFGYNDSTGKDKMSFLNPVDYEDRTMVNAFKYFQINTLKNKISNAYSCKDLSDCLVSGNWCLNNKAYSDKTGTTLLENLTYTSSSFYYDSYVRLYGKTTKEPTLKCPVDTMETFGDNTTPMYVATLTADEIVYAGGSVALSNPNYYLINNWQRSYYKLFWSLSPGNFIGNYDTAFYVDYRGSLYNRNVTNYDVAFRPAIVLRSDIALATNLDYIQDGTIDKPYVIE